MARGFESKSVADQQESAEARREQEQEPGASVDSALTARKQGLALARADIARRLDTASAPAHRQMLERALRALDDDLASLD
jgi:hypothetical protein